MPGTDQRDLAAEYKALRHEADALDDRLKQLEFEATRKASEPRADTEWLEQFFAYSHLPPQLQEIIKTLPRNPERATALRKILESKDCAVRAVVAK